MINAPNGGLRSSTPCKARYKYEGIEVVAMDASKRNQFGRFESEHGVSVEEVFEAMEPLEPYTTGELADLLDAPRRSVFNYLDELAEQGRIRKKKPEPRRAIWIRGD